MRRLEKVQGKKLTPGRATPSDAQDKNCRRQVDAGGSRDSGCWTKVRQWTRRGAQRSWWRDQRVWLLLTVAAVLVRSAWVRAGGLNPHSLWVDDLVYAAIIRNTDLLESLSVPIHVAPGLFLIWRWLHASIPDLELALQALPFVCALAAIPVVAVVVREADE